MQYLTQKQVAERLQVTQHVVAKWRRAGLPHLAIGYRCIRFDWDAVLAWLRTTSAQYQPANDASQSKTEAPSNEA